jgi:iron(III) transport system substrate-binding protein
VRRLTALLLALAALVLIAACGDDESSGDKKLTVYSGRAEQLVGPLYKQFEEKTGIKVEVRYGDSAELAATLSEEGDNTPADIFFAQDAGALGAVAQKGLLETLPPELVNRVEMRFRDDQGRWVGASARARVLAYSTERLKHGDLPASVFDLTDERWKGKLGFAPSNASFQAFISGMRIDIGDDRTRDWLKAIDGNDPKLYENNIQSVEAIANEEIDAALVNHYYLYEVRRERGDDVPVDNHFFRTGDPGSLVNAAGLGILKASGDDENARKLVEYVLSAEGQRYFAEKTAEYPLAAGVKPGPELRPLGQVQGPFIDLGQLGEKLPSTLEMIEEAGLTN